MRSAGLRDRSLVSMFHLATVHVALGERDGPFNASGKPARSVGTERPSLPMNVR